MLRNHEAGAARLVLRADLVVCGASIYLGDKVSSDSLSTSLCYENAEAHGRSRKKVKDYALTPVARACTGVRAQPSGGAGLELTAQLRIGRH
jgi:hypothetical protein